MKFLSKIFSKKDAIVRVEVSKRFDLMNRVGQGSMSKVWKAYDHLSGRTVALKVLDKIKTDRYEARFPGLNKPTEGDIAVSLRHPNIVETYEYGWTTADEQFLVMEYVEGVGLSLLTEMQNEQMQRYRLRYMIQIGYALDYLHKQGWIHRDLCPRNILVSSDNHIKLIDFGLVVPDIPDFRRPGNRTGTANYMAPELIKRQPTDQRIDLFSYGVTCFEMYANRLPWEAALTLETVVQHINKPPADLRTLIPNIDGEMHDIIMKGIATSPDERWQTAEEMLQALRKAEKRLVSEHKRARLRKAATAKKTRSEGDPSARKPAAQRKTDGKTVASAGKSQDGKQAARRKKAATSSVTRRSSDSAAGESPRKRAVSSDDPASDEAQLPAAPDQPKKKPSAAERRKKADAEGE